MLLQLLCIHSYTLSITADRVLESVCQRNPSLSYCNATGSPQQSEQTSQGNIAVIGSEQLRGKSEHGLERHKEVEAKLVRSADTHNVNSSDTRKDDESCRALKHEYDNLCHARANPQVASETAAFCKAYQNNCKELLEEEKKQLSSNETKPKTTDDDAACDSLKSEFEKICFAPTAASIARETKAFCDAYITKCRNLLGTAGTHIVIDYVAYCKKYSERFRYVCPDPLRFRKYAADALTFCERYSGRCPHEQVPSKPVPFRQKKEYYMRELEYLCNGQRHFAETYCTNRVAMKMPKYLFPCLSYKFTCVDVLSRVIYTG